MAKRGDIAYRLKQANRVAESIASMESHVAYLRSRLRSLLPISEMTRLLGDGLLTSVQYVQLLCDMGLSLAEATDQYNGVMNTNTTVPLSPLPPDLAVTEPATWQARHYWPARATAKRNNLTTPAQKVAGGPIATTSNADLA